MSDPLITAMTTEHFVLQSAAGTATSEESARASLYVMALSSTLVAMGFTVQTPAFAPLAAITLPVLVLLGLFTIARLVDTGLQTIHLRTAIARIRAYYRRLSPDAPEHIPAWGTDAATEAMSTLTVTGRRDWQVGLVTIATMIATINSVVTGAGITLLVLVLADSLAVALVAGIVLGLAHLAGFLLYQRRRYRNRPTPS
ncbi:hypothetical protein HII36_08185 [Nonomuraea sp. NN258]|uniref:hypothetical protein n=1 Tax=Nonomuraea antri TaxID=2730852 RepID=UPI001569D3B0|nr:hypothetical protein [Nonomuraea antri]NRQ31817.1 hypothetical protein [Nonomuraea antri]